MWLMAGIAVFLQRFWFFSELKKLKGNLVQIQSCSRNCKLP